jgi:uncharacterized protein with PIN domain
MGRDVGSIRAELIPELQRIARQLGRTVFPEGLPRGTKFSELEAIAVALGDEIARQLIESNVREQADDRPEEDSAPCPECRGPTSEAPDRTRSLTTTRGEVTWTEHARYCHRCRRAFFPSEPGAGP